nr:B3 domain-containing protein Os03g0212300-like [Aegilops tauschii subsp. strangulata]
MEGYVRDQHREFFIRLYKPVCGHLRLPTPFARIMELDPPQALRLHMRGFGNGGMRVNVNFPAPHVMYLRRGWKTFARAHSLSEGHVLQFKLMENGLLSVKVFGHLGTRLGCYAESSTDNETSSSGDSDEEDSDNDDEGSRREDADSDSG